MKSMDNCVDTREVGYLEYVSNALIEALDLRDVIEASQYIEQLFDDFQLEVSVPNEDQMRIMTESVNVERDIDEYIRINCI